MAEAIGPGDVDGFHPMNVGSYWASRLWSVRRRGSSISWAIRHKHRRKARNGGRKERIVGKPVSLLLLSRNATVPYATAKDLPDVTRQADILVAATGKPKMIDSSMVKGGAVVVDVGITRTQSGLIGDVDFDAVKEVASYITPVPGGIGPMTIAMLLLNALKAAEACASGSMRQ